MPVKIGIPNQMERKQFHKDKCRIWSNPIIFVKSENAHSIVGKSEYVSENKPFQRFEKYRDENGLYIITGLNTRVYQENWNLI